MKSIISTAVIFPIAFLIVTSLARHTKELYEKLNQTDTYPKIHQLHHYSHIDSCLYNPIFNEAPEGH